MLSLVLATNKGTKTCQEDYIFRFALIILNVHAGVSIFINLKFILD